MNSNQEKILQEYIKQSLKEAGFGKKTMLGLAASAGLYSGMTDKPKQNRPESVRSAENPETRHIDIDFEDEEEIREPRQLSFKETVPIIQKASQKFKVPASLIHAIVKTESNFNAHAVSNKGAIGMMQLMPATAERFGVEDPYDPEQNIMGGTKYLQFLMKKFDNDLELVVAAYNSGEGNVSKNLKKNGTKIPPFPETQRYVPKVLERMESSPLQ